MTVIILRLIHIYTIIRYIRNFLRIKLARSSFFFSLSNIIYIYIHLDESRVYVTH